MGTVGIRPDATASDILDTLEDLPEWAQKEILQARPDVANLASKRGMSFGKGKGKGKGRGKGDEELTETEALAVGGAMSAAADCAWCRYGKPAAVGAAVGLGLSYLTGMELAKGALWGGAGGLLYGQLWGSGG
jgi:hypothetical protein